MLRYFIAFISFFSSCLSMDGGIGTSTFKNQQQEEVAYDVHRFGGAISARYFNGLFGFNLGRTSESYYRSDVSPIKKDFSGAKTTYGIQFAPLSSLNLPVDFILGANSVEQYYYLDSTSGPNDSTTSSSEDQEEMRKGAGLEYFTGLSLMKSKKVPSLSYSKCISSEEVMAYVMCPFLVAFSAATPGANGYVWAELKYVVGENEFEANSMPFIAESYRNHQSYQVFLLSFGGDVL